MFILKILNNNNSLKFKYSIISRIIIFCKILIYILNIEKKLKVDFCFIFNYFFNQLFLIIFGLFILFYLSFNKNFK